ncbi:MAG: transglutaminase family protein [Ferruginibacter sp.]|nr:transglutaminase family protein [Ferruginibacter sp.]
MKFEVLSELQYEVMMPTTFIFNIQVSPSSSQTILEENLFTEPFFQLEEFTSTTAEARFLKLQVNSEAKFKISYKAVVDLHYNIIDQQQLFNTVPVIKLDADTIPYLFPSRYCQSDKLQKLATKEFGNIDNAYAKVSAINEWIYNNVEYRGGITNSSTSAHDTLTERVGVCRDFAHLGITLCRALSIPARYFTGYAYNLNPPDFHACFEAYIGGEWIFFDPTKLVPANGLVKIANGRDAADAAVASIFGNARSTSMIVQCESIDPDFKPYYINNTEYHKGLSYQ